MFGLDHIKAVEADLGEKNEYQSAICERLYFSLKVLCGEKPEYVISD